MRHAIVSVLIEDSLFMGLTGFSCVKAIGRSEHSPEC